jgi:hypothetical protein
MCVVQLDRVQRRDKRFARAYFAAQGIDSVRYAKLRSTICQAGST